MDFDFTVDYVSLPTSFVTLLKSNMQTHSKAFQSLAKLILEDDQLYSITHQTFAYSEKKLSVEFVVKSYGWLGFRDKIAANFVHHSEMGSFSKDVDLNLINDILSLEKTFSFLSMDGYSRIFLLGLYLKLSTNFDFIFSSFQDRAFIKALKKAKGRHIQTDFFLLIAYLLFHMLGEEFTQVLDTGISFEKVFQKVSAADQKRIIGHCLRYAASINDSSLFVPDVI